MSRAVLQPFQQYQKARTQFVQTVAELATRPQNIDALQSAGVMALLRPLLLDNVPCISQSAALALGRLASYSEELAQSVVNNQILSQLVNSLNQQNVPIFHQRFYKKAAAFVLRAVAKHSSHLAKAVVDSGALDALVVCLQEFDPTVKEAAAWALSYIAKHTPQLAQSVVQVGAVSLLILCIQQPEPNLKRVAANALGEISKHSPQLAQQVVDEGATPFLAQLINHNDAQLKRQVCSCLANIAKHTTNLAEIVVDNQIFPKILYRLKDPDLLVRKFAATCIREIAKHTADLAKLICNSGGAMAIVDYITEAKGNNALPGFIILGYISAFDQSLAWIIIMAKAITPLKQALGKQNHDNVKSAAAWSLGNMGGHTPDHARSMAEANVPRLLLDVVVFDQLYTDPKSSEQVKKKAKKALKSILQMCDHLNALQPLIQNCPHEILTYVLHQFQKTLPTNNAAKKSFIQSGGLKKILSLKPDGESKLKQYIDQITNLYPEEIVKYYSVGYEQTLLKKIDEEGN